MSRHRVLLTISGIAIIGAAVVLVAFAETAMAQAPTTGQPVAGVSWISFTGLLALLGLAVQWGKVQERGERTDGRLNRIEGSYVRQSALMELKADMEARFDRTDRSIESLRVALELERRAGARRRPDGD